jgi:hypothetical protein
MLRLTKEKKVQHFLTPLKSRNIRPPISRAALKGLSHEIDFKIFDKYLQNLA